MNYELRIKNLGRRPRKRGTPARSRGQRNAIGWSSGFSRSQRESKKGYRVVENMRFVEIPIWPTTHSPLNHLTFNFPTFPLFTFSLLVSASPSWD